MQMRAVDQGSQESTAGRLLPPRIMATTKNLPRFTRKPSPPGSTTPAVNARPAGQTRTRPPREAAPLPPPPHLHPRWTGTWRGRPAAPLHSPSRSSAPAQCSAAKSWGSAREGGERDHQGRGQARRKQAPGHARWAQHPDRAEHAALAAGLVALHPPDLQPHCPTSHRTTWAASRSRRMRRSS